MAGAIFEHAKRILERQGVPGWQTWSNPVPWTDDDDVDDLRAVWFQLSDAAFNLELQFAGLACRADARRARRRREITARQQRIATRRARRAD